MNALIRDLLDLSKIEAGRFVLQPEPASVAELVEEALVLLRPLAEAKRQAVHEQIVDDGVVNADRERIYQVLSNLLGNAIKFTPPGGTLTVRTQRVGHEIHVSVADTGPGIAAGLCDRVFDRYWQERRTASEGAGLGLFIARGIVEAHGGRIWVDSPGVGARFTFALPLA